jgi:hypothetical protein
MTLLEHINELKETRLISRDKADIIDNDLDGIISKHIPLNSFTDFDSKINFEWVLDILTKEYNNGMIKLNTKEISEKLRSFRDMRTEISNIFKEAVLLATVHILNDVNLVTVTIDGENRLLRDIRVRDIPLVDDQFEDIFEDKIDTRPIRRIVDISEKPILDFQIHNFVDRDFIKTTLSSIDDTISLLERFILESDGEISVSPEEIDNAFLNRAAIVSIDVSRAIYRATVLDAIKKQL